MKSCFAGIVVCCVISGLPVRELSAAELVLSEVRKEQGTRLVIQVNPADFSAEHLVRRSRELRLRYPAALLVATFIVESELIYGLTFVSHRPAAGACQRL